MIYDYGEGKGLRDLEKVVRQTTRALRTKLDEFDSIIVRGCSGMLVGSPVALRLKKPLCVARKKTEKAHDYSPVINHWDMGERVLFLDDFVDSGETLKETMRAMRDAIDGFNRTVPMPQVTHVYTYGEHGTRAIGWQEAPAISNKFLLGRLPVPQEVTSKMPLVSGKDDGIRRATADMFECQQPGCAAPATRWAPGVGVRCTEHSIPYVGVTDLKGRFVA